MGKLELTRKYYQLYNETKEYFNALQTNIQLSGDGLKVISVTSTVKSEGKSTISVGLSMSLALSGYKVLLLDVDLRNSVMSGMFHSRERITGLTEYLSGKAGMADSMQETTLDNLYILQAGVVSPNPLSLLRSVKFETLIDSMKKYFDYIIVDTPPIGQVIDAAIIAQQCDGIFLVTEMRKTTRRQIFSSLQQLEQTGVPVLGLVANKAIIKKDSYGYYGKNTASETERY